MADGLLVSVERAVLACALRSQDHYLHAVGMLDGYKFAGLHHGWVWSQTRQFRDKFEAIPDKDLWLAFARRCCSKDGEFEELREVVEAIWTNEQPAPEIAFGLLESLARIAVLQQATEKVDELLSGDQADILGAEVQLEEALRRSRERSRVRTELPWADPGAVVERLRRYQSHEPELHRVPVPIGALHKHLHKGVPAGRLVMLQATTNVGKSTIAAGFGIHAAKSGMAVVHLVTEELLEDHYARYDAGLTGIDRETLAAGNLSEALQDHFLSVFATRSEELVSRVHLHSLEPGSRLYEAVPLIDKARASAEGVPLLIVLDSPDHLRSGRRYEQERFDIRDVWMTMKGWSKSFRWQPCAVLATTHSSARYEGKIPTNRAGAESYDKARLSDLVLGLADRGELKDGRRNMLLAWTKNRIGRMKNYGVLLHVDMGTCHMEQFGQASPLKELDVGEDESA